MYMYDKKFMLIVYYHNLKKFNLWDSTQSMPHACLPSRDGIQNSSIPGVPHPPYIPAHSQSEGTSTLQQKKRFLSAQISPPLKPAPRGTFPHKIPKLPPARPERDDRPPPSPMGPMHQRHNSVPVHKS